MALLSPGIQLFESSVTPATTVATAANGVATLGYSTRGPENKLTKISSVSEFKEVFGDPVAEFPYAHIMAQSVLANNTDVYFMRLADPNTKENANCTVASNFKVEGAVAAIKDNLSTTQGGYFMAKWRGLNGNTKPTDPTLRIVIAGAATENNFVDTKMEFSAAGFGPAGAESENILYVSLVDVINNLRAKYGQDFTFIPANVTSDPEVSSAAAEIGIIIKAKSETKYDNSSVDGLTISVHVGNYDPNSVVFWCWDKTGTTDTSTTDSILTVEEAPKTTGPETVPYFSAPDVPYVFAGTELREKSTIASFDSLDDYDHFVLEAKYSGSSMNGVRVVKSTVTSVNGSQTWTVTVYDGEGVIESRAGITPETFLKEMSKFEYIDIVEEELATGETQWTWVDGTWDLGYGLLLSNGEYWNPAGHNAEKGKDGFPTVKIGDKEEYSESQSVNLYLKALGNEEFVNADEFTFSILATPGMQNTMVQNAAIQVCATRGDAIFLADVPYDMCQSKQLIDDVVAWANGNSGFQSSYCAIYYGWFYQTNPYDTDNSIACPASCFIAPKMVALDQSMGEFYAPAGITRGTLICSDWSYSPDQKDRDKLVGNDNVVNPISYSNTRGVTIMAQKTTDRTTSPLNRVGIRRMTNMIKRNLRSRLVALLFEPNNETSRARARSIVDDVMAGLRSDECIETYDISVISGTGANRNDLNIYLSYAPYGLIEKIYVYLSITDAGVEVTENVA